MSSPKKPVRLDSSPKRTDRADNLVSSTPPSSPIKPSSSIKGKASGTRFRITPATADVLFEIQDIAPSNTFFHLRVNKNRTVLLMDWPRMRIMSAKWSRNGAMNPTSRIVPFEEFVESDGLKSDVVLLFGEDTLAKILAIIGEVKV